MDSLTCAEGFGFDGPALYRIRIQGRLAASWPDRLEGMTISLDTRGKEAPTTTLLGELPDQAALSGVLHTLYEQHRPLLSVECLFAGNNTAKRAYDRKNPF